MASLKKIQEKMVGVKKTSKVTKAMESISAIKMRTAQRKAMHGKKYTLLVFSILKRISKIVSGNVDDIFSFAMPEKGKTIILLVSPNKGLTGGMNNLLFKKIDTILTENKILKNKVSFVCVGKKGYDFVSKEGYHVDKYFNDISERNAQVEMKRVSEHIENLYRGGEYLKVISIYTNFINTTEQEAVARNILPVVYEDLKKVLTAITPNKGKFSNEKKVEIDNSDVDSYVFEPNIEVVIKGLIPFILNIDIYNSLLESFASEHSARMIAMKNSTDKANELAEKLRKKFNKERQAQITKEISEIVSGIEAMK